MIVFFYGGPRHDHCENIDEPIGVSLTGWPEIFHDDRGRRKITTHKYTLYAHTDDPGMLEAVYAGATVR